MILLLRALIAALVLLQRFAVPVGDEQLALLVPVMSAIIAAGVFGGLLRVDRRRLVLVVVLVGTAALATLVQVVAGVLPSLLSFALLAVLYAPAVLTPKGDRAAYRSAARFFVGLMSVSAVLSILQFALQYSGRATPDVIADLVPAQFVLQDFNPGNAIQYGSQIDRASAWIFVEPSFLSLFLGLAVVVALRLRMRWPVVTLLLLGIVPTVAGNGLVVLAGGVLVFVLLRHRHRLTALLPAAVAGVVALVATPFGALYLQRGTEGGGANTSSGLRFVQPYVELVPPPLQQPFTALFGRGAGAASDYILQNDLGALLATVLPKILFEFGLVGVVGMLLPLLLLFVAPLRKQPELLGLVVSYFVVNASLQAAIMTYLVLLFLLWLPDLAVREHHDEPAEAAPALGRAGQTAGCRSFRAAGAEA